MEMIAGGASFAPNRWSFPAVATLNRNKSWCSSTALIMAAKNTKNCAFSCGVSPGSSRLIPVSVDNDQLLCLPLPLMPSNGFSWSRATNPCFLATRWINSIVNWLWSVAIFVVAKIGANSCWAGATSLCSVLAKMPSFHNSWFKSDMNSCTRDLIVPK